MFKPPLVAPYVLVVAGTTAPGIKQGAPSHWWRSKPSLYIGCRNSKKDRKEGSYKNDKNDGGSLLYICWFLFSSIPKSDHPKYPKHGSHRGALTRSPDWVLEYQLPAGLCLARGWGNGVFPIVPMVDVPTAHLGWLTPPCHQRAVPTGELEAFHGAGPFVNIVLSNYDSSKVFECIQQLDKYILSVNICYMYICTYTDSSKNTWIISESPLCRNRSWL